MPVEPSPDRFTRRMWIAWLAFVISLALTLVSWRHALDSDEREAGLRFAAITEGVREAIRDRMNSHELLLLGGVAFFAGSLSVDREEWQKYVTGLHLQRHYPGVQGMGFARLVAAGERETHIRAIRAEGYPDYTIHPAGERPEYAAIDYLEPFSGRNLRTFGYDMLADPTRRAAMERSRDTGETGLTARVTLVQEPGQNPQAGALMYLPVYRNGAPQASVAERQAALFGYVYAAFLMNDLIHSIATARTPHVDLKIYDGTEVSPAARLYDNDRPRADPPRLVRDLALETGGRTWTLRLSSTPELEAQLATSYPQVMLMGGMALSALILFLSFALLALRKQATALAIRQAELQQSRERLNFLLGTTPAVIYAAQASGDYAASLVSGNVRAQLGYDPEEFTSDPGFWANHVHPDDRDRVFAGLSTLFEAGKHAHEYRFRHKDGSWRWMRDELQVIRDASSAPQEMVGYWIDVTARKHAEDALRESTARYERAVNGANDGIWEWIPSTGEDYLSPRWKQLLGYDDHELPNVQESFLDRIHPEDRARVAEAIRAHLEERKPFAVELRMRCKSGEYRWFSSKGQAEWGELGQPLRMSGSLSDISEHKQAEAKLQRLAEQLGLANQGLAHLNRMKTEFMSSITHELRTPLNAVIGFAELLQDQVPGPLNAKQAEFVGDIVGSGERLLTLVEGILEMSRLDAADNVLEREPVDIGAALEERVAAQRRAAEARGVTMTLEDAADAGSAELDPTALRRMLDALLDNAIKFNREGGAVRISARRDGGRLEIAVADTGIGIAREDLAKLFQPLVQLDAGLDRRAGGIGLGLALARRLAELHGGTIEVISEPGTGSTFTLRLPLREEA